MKQSVEWEGRVEKRGDERVIVPPKDLVLVGEAIKIRQDDWDEITIRPTSPEGLAALDRFGPFGDWNDEEMN